MSDKAWCCPFTGSTVITASVSELTSLQYLELWGGPLTAAAAMMHLQHLTRLTSLYLSSKLGAGAEDESSYCNSFIFGEAVVRGQVCVEKMERGSIVGIYVSFQFICNVESNHQAQPCYVTCQSAKQ
jgi:hypothetical protein